MSMVPEKHRTRPITVGFLWLSCALLTGCGADPAPSGDRLYGEAESTYLEYREFLNELQITLYDGPWEIGQVGSYGMQPIRCEGGNGYYFSLHRNVLLDGTKREAYADITEDFLTQKGLAPTRGTLGSDDQAGQVIQVSIHDKEEFSTLLVEFRKNGNIGISADTPCHPGDSYELSALLFGGMYLSEGYLPVDTESPRDPLFFGITPGDPQFVRETPTPTPTP